MSYPLNDGSDGFRVQEKNILGKKKDGPVTVFVIEINQPMLASAEPDQRLRPAAKRCEFSPRTLLGRA